MQLKQGSTTNVPFFMRDSTDSNSGKTGLSPTATIYKNTGSFGAPAGAVSEIGNGWYQLAANGTDLANKGMFLIHATATGADPWDDNHEVVTDLPGDTVASVTGAVGSVTGAVGSVTGAVGSVTAAVTITAGSVQAIWDALTSALTTVNSIGKLLVTNIDSTISSRLATSGYTAPPSAATIAQAVWDALTSALTTTGSIGKLLVTNVNAVLSTLVTTSHFDTIIGTPAVSIAADIAEVEAETDGIASIPTTDNTAAITAIKAKTDNLPAAPAATGDIPSASTIATAVWSVLTSALTTSGSIGKLLVDKVDAAISSIKAKTDNLPAAPAATGDAMTLTSGERTTLTGVIWNTLTSALTTVGSIGKRLADNVDTNIGSRAAPADIPTSNITAIKAKTDNLPTIPASQGDVTTVGTAVATVQTTVNGINVAVSSIPTNPLLTSDSRLNNLDAKVSDVKTKTDNLPASPAATGAAMTLTSGERTSIGAAVWASTFALTAGSWGRFLYDQIAYIIGSLDGGVALTNADKNTLVDKIWDEPVAGHMTAGTTGEAVQSGGGGGGDPAAIADAVWQRARIGAQPSGSFGEFIDAPISSVKGQAIADVAGVLEEEIVIEGTVINNNDLGGSI
jgi:hypothetical protein